MPNAVEKFNELMQPGDRLELHFGKHTDDPNAIEDGEPVMIRRHTPDHGCWLIPATAVWVPDEGSRTGAQHLEYDIAPDTEATLIADCR